MKKVIVSGLSGFVGRHVIQPLTNLGFDIHGISRKKTGRFEKENISFHQTDFLSCENISNLMNEIKPEYFLHLAWDVTHGEYWSSAENKKWNEASKKWIEAFVEAGGKRIVGAGTCAEYEWNDKICREDDELKPSTIYGTEKAELQSWMSEYCSNKGVSSAWGRIFFLYGPYENKNRLVPSVINALINKKEVGCTHGNQIRDFLHVFDAGDVFAQLLDSEIEGPVNLGSGKEIRQKDLVLEIGNQFNAVDLINFGQIKASDPNYLVPKLDRLFEELNWKPSINLANGVEKTILWWKERGKLDEDYH